MALRQRSPAADLALRVLEGFQQHRTGRNAALVSHYGFLSVFPLMVVLTTILGFVLQNRKDLQDDIIDSALGNLPFVGAQIAKDPASLRGSTVVLIVGLMAALWAGMKAFVAVQAALDDIHEIALNRRSSFVHARMRAVGGIVVIGGAQVATAFITSLVGVLEVGLAGQLALIVAAIFVNTIVLGLTYRWLCSVTDSWRHVLPGAVGGGVLFAILQLLGTTIVTRAIANASPVYGSFAAVIGVLTWLSLHATIALVGADLNQVLAAHAGGRRTSGPSGHQGRRRSPATPTA
jgi:YihY family inner membrane protein